ncbi:MAG: hypothetical protein NZM29_03185, partial [Nitrospira sp.]|nr:hypothetical protein [Nitrospira sp.]
DLKEGNNQVILGDTTGAVQLTKNVKVKTGAGDDLFEMYRVLVTGTCTINTGAGGDAIRFEYGSTFTGFVMVDSGAGDDLLQAGFQTGAPSTTNFNGGLIAKLGDGNDELLLGLDPGAGGDANSLANFGAASIIDGGTGLNLFDGLTLLWVPYQPPSAYAGPLTLLNWTDPLP